MTMFDPDSFLNTEITGANSTSVPAIPEMEALLVAKDVASRTSGDWVLLDITWIVDEEEAREVTGMKEPTVRQSVFLDITDSGGLDMSEGKNVQLGRVRKALGQNDPEIAWFPSMIVGGTARGKITQRPDKNDPERIYNAVNALVSA